mgnify:FL=1
MSALDVFSTQNMKIRNLNLSIIVISTPIQQIHSIYVIYQLRQPLSNPMIENHTVQGEAQSMVYLF